MNPLSFLLLADENIHPAVVHFLRQQRYDVWSVVGQGLIGQGDEEVLRAGYDNGRVVLTHDSDFGTLAVAQNRPIVGIIYLRPGHIQPEFTIGTLETIARQSLDVSPPFIIVAERKGQTVRIRVREL